MGLTTVPTDWQPPPEVIAAGNAARVRYTNPPRASEVPARYRTATRTQLPIGRGTKALRDYVVRRFGVSQTYMPGRSRPMRDADRLDTHQNGNAIDFMTYRDTAKGAAIANFLILNADAIGIQYIVFNGNRWSSGQPSGRKWSAYEGSVKHRDHPHVELTPEGARGETLWFSQNSIALPGDAVAHAEASAASAPYADAGSFIDEHGDILRDTGIASVIVLLLAGGAVAARIV